jgi:PQQ-like domain
MWWSPQALALDGNADIVIAAHDYSLYYISGQTGELYETLQYYDTSCCPVVLTASNGFAIVGTTLGAFAVAPALAMSLSWNFTAWYNPPNDSPLIWAPPEDPEGFVYFSANSGRFQHQLLRMNVHTGAVVWNITVIGDTGRTFFGNGLVLVQGGLEQPMVAYDMTSGTQVWSAFPPYVVTEVFGFTPRCVVAMGYYYTGGSAYCLNVLTGAVVWNVNITNNDDLYVAYDIQYMYVSSVTTTLAVSLSTGTVVWSTPFVRQTTQLSDMAMVPAPNLLYLINYVNGSSVPTITAVWSGTGAIAWQAAPFPPNTPSGVIVLQGVDTSGIVYYTAVTPSWISINAIQSFDLTTAWSMNLPWASPEYPIGSVTSIPGYDTLLVLDAVTIGGIQSAPNPTPTSTPAHTTPGSGVSAGAVAGAVIGSLAGVGLVVGAVWWYHRRGRSTGVWAGSHAATSYSSV